MKYLIVGLGNIGSEYVSTRHNIGFSIIDYLAHIKKTDFSSKRYALHTSIKHRGRNFILLKPTTYMNLSGKAVRYWMDKEKIPINNILIITDDIALDTGTLRLKKKGGDGGHNGLNDIINTLNTNEFSRLRFGIGNSFSQGMQSNYVLGKWTNQENEILNNRIPIATDIILSFGTIGSDRTMTAFNNK